MCLTLSGFWQGVPERCTDRLAGRTRSVARRRLFRIAGLMSGPVGRPRAVVSYVTGCRAVSS